MKVEFKSAKEKAPQQEEGLEVIYGPGKRMAFKLRWYLIVFLVTSPLILIAYNVISAMVLMESSGKLILPSQEVFAEVAGRVQKVHVKAGDDINAHDLILSLTNLPVQVKYQELLRLKKLDGMIKGSQGFVALEAIIERQISEAAAWERKIAQYVKEGVTNASELRDASDKLAEANRSLMETRLRKQQWEQDMQRQAKEGISDAEIELAKKQVEALKIKVQAPASVVDVYTQEGQWVEKGEAVARIRSESETQVWLYVHPKYAEHTKEGEQISVYLPNGDAIEATIVKGADRALKTPNELRKAFSGNEPGLWAVADLNEPLPQNWMIENLPVTARFTPYWLQAVKSFFD